MGRYQLPNYSINLREAPIKKECGTNPVQRIRFKASKKQRTSDLSYWNYPEEAMVKPSALKSYGFYIHIYKDFVLSLWAENPRADTDLSNKKTFFFNLEKNNNLNLDMFRVWVNPTQVFTKKHAHRRILSVYALHNKWAVQMKDKECAYFIYFNFFVCAFPL